jgi:glycosyltransferase involved in cell wall biosynthesis
MKILFVAMPSSIHSVRWITQLNDSNWDIHLFPSDDSQLNTTMPQLTFHQHFAKLKFMLPQITYKPIYTINGTNIIAKIFRRLQWFYINQFKSYLLTNENSLVHTIQKIKPDIIHSLETQLAGYITLEAKKKIGQDFPIWIHSNWGSDIFLFARLKKHQERVKEVLLNCNYYFCECNRDINLAHQYGFQGEVLPVFPNTGGLKLEELNKLKKEGKTSQRHIIMLKGYNSWAGRGIVGLRALERCKDLLKDYQIIIYSNDSIDMHIAAELFYLNTNIQVRILPKGTSHEEIMSWHGQARISIGLSISDAISTSFLEAITMGSFPIQSYTSCANEWIKDGETGLLVPPEDVEIIEQAIRKALTNNNLVDIAAEKNYQTVSDRLEYNKVQKKAVQMYENIYQKIKNRK